MTEQEFYQKTDECIARFKNGKERYKTSATFNRVIQMLVRDVDPYIDKSDNYYKGCRDLFIR